MWSQEQTVLSSNRSLENLRPIISIARLRISSNASFSKKISLKIYDFSLSAFLSLTLTLVFYRNETEFKNRIKPRVRVRERETNKEIERKSV